MNTLIAGAFVFLPSASQFDPIKIKSKVRVGQMPGYNSVNWVPIRICQLRKSSFIQIKQKMFLKGLFTIFFIFGQNSYFEL